MEDVAAVLSPLLPALSDEIVEAIAREIDDYRRPLQGRFGRNVRLGTERALQRFVAGLRPGAPADDGPARRIYVDLGAGEFRDGRGLDALLAAYRLGARLAWRRITEAGAAAGLAPPTLYRLGEALFAYIDGLSAESAEGYALAQSAAAGEREQRRRELLDLLTAGPEPPDEEAARAAADAAGWPLPATLAALVAPGRDAGALATRLGPGVLAAPLDPATLVALVPDAAAPGRRAQLAQAAPGGALGPEGPWSATRRSLERARLAHRLQREGRLPADRLLAAEEHLAALLLHRDPGLARDLAEHALAPLADAPPRLHATLAAWLDHRGRVEETAHALGVHPQTVRYRLAQLRERLGPRLEDPEARLTLALALRAGGPAAPPGGSPGPAAAAPSRA